MKHHEGVPDMDIQKEPVPELQEIPIEQESDKKHSPIVNITGELDEDSLPGSTPPTSENEKEQTEH
jgi:hypothetical protein